MTNELKKADQNIEKKVKLFQKGLNLLISKKGYITNQEKRIEVLKTGCKSLYIFFASSLTACAVILPGFFGLYPGVGNFHEARLFWLILTSIVVIIENILFWKGIILVYLTSQQMGIKLRVIGAICGPIPIANLIVLMLILKTTSREIVTETARLKLNKSRKDKQICKTKYPIILIHGIFFRDSSLLNYWGRIPEELIQNGATIYYGNHNSASPIMVNAKHLAQRIKMIVESTGCEKVNIIAHSKGGLDSRAMIAKTDAAPYIASLTTINTPHRGCSFADYLLQEFDETQKQNLADFYNSAAATMGDCEPDFITAVTELAASKCAKFNEEIKDDPNVYYQSVGSLLNDKKAGVSR